MKVLIVLALVAAASCTPAKEGEREKRNLFGSYPLGYSAGLSPVGVAAPLVAGPVQQDTFQSQHTHSSALKSTFTSSVQNSFPAVHAALPAYSALPAIQPAVAAYQPTVAAYQPAVAAYQPTVAAVQPIVSAVQPNLINYAQPAYYSAPAQVVPSFSYNAAPVQFVSQPALYNYPAYSGVVAPAVVGSPLQVSSNVVAPSVVSSSAVAGSPAVSSSNLDISTEN